VTCFDYPLIMPKSKSKLKAIQLKLFVYVIGLGTTSFPIRINNSETVGDLREAVFEKIRPLVLGVEALQLTLYRVTLPDTGRKLAESASKALQHELDVAACTLCEVFAEQPPPKTVNIVVVLPEGFQIGERLCNL
jgi:hypothetical protein